MAIQPIETRYAGHRFRSRLEARWAVFFDRLDIRWEYEPQGFILPLPHDDTTPYLPDFLLPDCGTWIEVKGAEEDLDHQLMTAAALHLPDPKPNMGGPRIMILGPIPEAPRSGDWGWMGLTPFTDQDNRREVGDAWWGFGGYIKSGRPWVLSETSKATPYAFDDGTPWLQPAHDYTVPYSSAAAYTAARSARFEHGESGA
ncbi:hypothetical protein ACWCRF_11525 [Streptomyces sp. NPDC002405]